MSNLNILHKLVNSKQIECPRWLPDNLMYLTVMGSHAYGCHTETSDWDYYGMAMIPKEYIFPHKNGLILGFDQIPVFEQWNKTHFVEQDSQKDMELTIYGIVRYFNLLTGGNPNITESLFTARECVIYATPTAERIRENRSLFLSKQSFYKTRSYAFAQLQKLDRVPIGKRKELIEKFGYDTKFAAGVVRLIDNCEQILTGELDLRRNREMVKDIRRGEWTLTQIREYAQQKELTLDKAASESKLPEKPDKDKIRTLLLSCLESHYGSLDKVVEKQDKYKCALMEIQDVLDRIRV